MSLFNFSNYSKMVDNRIDRLNVEMRTCYNDKDYFLNKYLDGSDKGKINELKKLLML